MQKMLEIVSLMGIVFISTTKLTKENKMNNSNFKMASDEAIKFLANKNNMTTDQVSMLIIEGGKAKDDYMKLMQVSIDLLNA